MKINIHTPSGLIPISPEVTKQTIIEALGYNPADQAAYDSIDATDDTTFYIIDSQQHVLAKVDADGLHAAIMTVNGKDVESGLIYDIKELDDDSFYIVDKDQNVLFRIDGTGLTATNITAIDAVLSGHSVVEHIEDESKHITEEERQAWNEKSKFDSISEDDDSTLYINDKNDQVIAQFDSEGLSTTGISANTINVVGYLTAVDAVLSDQSVVEHMGDTVIHVTADDRLRWDNKSDFESITEDDDSNLSIVDKNKQIIAKFGADGLQTTGIQVNTLDAIGDITAADAVLGGDSVVAHMNDYDKHLGDDITVEDDAALSIVDKNSKTIAKFDASGLATTNIAANDVEVSGNSVLNHVEDNTRHITENERSLWNTVSSRATKTELNTHIADTDKHLGDEIRLDDDTALSINDKNNNTIVKIDASGLTAGEITIKSGLEAYSVLDHITDSNIHLQDGERDTWNAKADQADLDSHIADKEVHLGDEIKLDDDSAFYINDVNNNTIVKVDSEGLNASNLFVQGQVVATEEYVKGKVTGLFEFKGSISSNADIPTTHEVGDTYRISKAGTYAGQTCEIGDMLVCIANGTTANNADWTVMQLNWSAVDGKSDLAWNTSVTLATIGGIDINAKLPANPNKDTTYTFTGGTNKITVDPSDADAYDVSITPSISLSNGTKGSTTTAGTFLTGVSGSGTTSHKVTATAYTGTLGSTTKGIYFDAGVPKEMSYSVNIDVPADAKFTDTNTKVTSVGNHYTPSENTESQLSADASSTTNAEWNTTSLVTGVNLQRDAKGHVVGVTVDSIKMPEKPSYANPNDGTLTLKVGSKTKTFSANQATNESFEVTLSDLNVADIATIRSNASTAYGWGNHANAGYLTSVPSEYITETELNAKGYLTSETYTGTITEVKMNGVSKGTSGVVDLGTVITNVDNKVDKVDGKGLSTNDFTDTLKTKLEGLSNYNDTEVRGLIADKYTKPSTGIPKSDLANDVQASLGKADTALQSYTEKYTGTYSKPSEGIPKSDLSSDVQTSLGKADTALQSYTEKYTGTYSKPDSGIPKTDLDVNVQTSLSKADTALQEETYKGTVTSVGLTMPDAFTVTGSPVTTEGTLTVTLKSDKYIPSVTDKNNWNAAEANVQANWNETNESSDAFILNKPTLATVATSGSYNDLANKPSIPTGFSITVNPTDDNVVDLTASGGTNSVTIDVKHAKQGPASGYTSGNETTSISSGTTKFKIPQLTVNAYGHVTAAEDEEIAITIPTAINGDKGDSVTAAASGTSTDSNGYTITPITFTVGDDTLSAVNVKAKHGYTPVKGVDYFDGKSISSVTKKSGSGTAGTTDTYSVKVDTTEVGTFDVYQGKDFKYEDFTAEQLASLKGFSPTHSWNGTKLTFTDINGQGAAVDLKGEKGDPGTSVTIKGTKSSVEELPEDSLTNPNVNGDGYIVNGYLYVWDGDSWENVGEIKGPQGDKGEDGKEIVSITSDASQTSGYTETTVTVTYNDNTSNTFKVNAKNGGLDNHTHPFTPEGTNSNTVAGGTVTGYFTGSEVTTGQSTSSVSVSKSDHTHSINASTSTTTSVASKSHTHSANAADAELSISVATSAHKHTVSVTGDVESSFSGTPATIAKTTTAGESVASALHTHSIDITGSVSSTFTGSEVASSNNGPSYLYEAGVLTINFGHTHNVTAAGGVNTTFTGSTVNSGTPSATTIVASNAHTHSYTPAGTVTSSLNNVSATVEASDTNASVTKSDHTHTVAATTSYTDVSSTEHIHTMDVSTSSESVSKSKHTHTVTAAGSLTDLTFTGTEHTHTFTGTAGVTGNPS